jgi:ubiquinol-cytochrome c reductase iron-sulfur subunit
MKLAKRKLLTLITGIISGGGVIAVSIPFFKALLPSARTRVAGAPVTVDISNLAPGTLQTVQWRGKPVWILRRTDRMLDSLEKVKNMLRDPDSRVESQQPEYAQNPTRSIKPEYFVCIGLCTHLGCVPSFRPEIAPPDLGRNWQGGYFCPCHGSRFDLAGRVYKGVPAPTNLVIPSYTYINQTKIIIGEETLT